MDTAIKDIDLERCFANLQAFKLFKQKMERPPKKIVHKLQEQYEQNERMINRGFESGIL